MGCFGQAFDRTNYQLVRDISVKILELSENGGLYRLQQQWLPYYYSECSKYSADKSGGSIQLHVEHFWGIFVISGLVSAIVLLFYMVQWKWNSSRVASSTPLKVALSTPPTPAGSFDPNPLPEGSCDQGGGGYIPDQRYGPSGNDEEN